MSLEASAFCLTPPEVQTLTMIALHEPISEDILNDKHAVQALMDKGFVEKVHQDVANLDRYRLTINGRIKHRTLNFICG